MELHYVPKLKTGIKRIGKLIDGGIESGSCNALFGSAGTGRTVFSMQLLCKEWRKEKS